MLLLEINISLNISLPNWSLYMIVWGLFLIYNIFLNKEDAPGGYLSGIGPAFNFLVTLLIALVLTLLLKIFL